MEKLRLGAIPKNTLMYGESRLEIRAFEDSRKGKVDLVGYGRVLGGTPFLSFAGCCITYSVLLLSTWTIIDRHTPLGYMVI